MTNNIKCSLSTMLKLTFLFDNQSQINCEIGVGDLVNITYKYRGTTNSILGKILKMHCSSTEKREWYLLIEDSIDNTNIAKICPLDITECDIIEKSEAVKFIETPDGPNEIRYLRVFNDQLQYCKDGRNWIPVKTESDNIILPSDIIQSETEPTSGDYILWVDNSNPELTVLKFFNGTEWISISEYNIVSGSDGKSAYDIAVEHGFEGSEEEWLESLKGEPGVNGTDGINGSDGKSAYDIAVEQGFTGTEEDWLESLKGVKGDKGDPGNDGAPGFNGKSAYDIAVNNGFVGTEEEWLESLKGDNGDPGVDGTDGSNGKSAYDIAVEHGFVGTEEEWLESLKGEPGVDGTDGSNGKSAYDIAVNNGFVGTEEEWLESLKGDKGDPGNDGTPGKDGTNGKDGSNGSDGVDGESAYDIAVNNGFVGTEEEWLESLKGDKGDPGNDGKEGRSVKSVTTDEANNVIATYSDGTSEVLGKLDVNVQGNFLTEVGFGDLRYYNGKFQYYNSSTSTWVDASVGPENTYVINMIPQPMKSIYGFYDMKSNLYKLKFEEPDDTVIDGQVACIVDKVIIRRKLGSAPIDENDGDLVIEIKRKNFGTYKNSFFADNGVTPNINDIYYYKAFPISTTGFANSSTVNEIEVLCKSYYLYGFKIDQNESDPESMITYIEDNKDFASVYMDYSSGVFNYGDWEDAWFIKNLKPCMLKYDGTVDYELVKNDYTKKLDGTASDISNTSYEGNAMIGIPKVYWKIVDNGDNTANVYFSDGKVDEGFHCWSHIDNNGNEIDYCYMPIYNGVVTGGKLRSLSFSSAPSIGYTAQQEIDYAMANNVGDDVIWYTEVIADRILINLLLILIGKSTNTQKVFGYGCNSSSGMVYVLNANVSGLFNGYGSNMTGNPVKIFGMGDWWGNVWRRVAGLICDKGSYKIKMTYGQDDGSTVDGYNLDGTGYIDLGISLSENNSGYIDTMVFNQYGLIPVSTQGSSSTYYTDGLSYNASIIGYALTGGDLNSNTQAGALALCLNTDSSYTGYVGASLSCKPLASTT